jgi:tetratricopeptide (TPR) repeat protein
LAGLLKKLLSRAGRKPGRPREYTQQEIEAVWEGTPFLQHLPYAKVATQGHDKTYITAMASEYFDMARSARERGNTDGMILALCIAIALWIIAGDYLGAATALGNLAMTYEQRSEFKISLRLQRYALQLKLDYGGTSEMVARSYWLIGRSEAALGQYREAEESLKTSMSILPNPKVVAQLRWIRERIAHRDTVGKVPPNELS